jgi:[ribosomal protein S5]-alanine N-acetyltransferase
MLNTPILPTITADRVHLRWLTEVDATALFSIFSNEEVMRYWSSLPMSDMAEAHNLLSHVHDCFTQKALFQWGIALNGESEKIVGTCTLSHLDRSNRKAQVGYALAREHWGKGYINEALTALLDFAFGELNLHRVEADIDPYNEASIRVVEKLGFQREGYLRESWIIGGEFKDALYFGLLKREWLAHRNAIV